MANNDLDNTKPITELSDEESKVKAFAALKDAAYQGSIKAIRQSEYNHRFFMGEHFLSRQPDGSWGSLAPLPYARHAARTQSPDVFEAIQALVPLYVRNKPDIQILPEEGEQPVDLRTMDDAGELTGGYSDSDGLSQAKTAEGFTDIYNTLLARESELVQHAMIVLESMISGACYVTYKWKWSEQRGTQIEPHILMRENFMPDPNGMDWWDFDDFRYTIIRQYMTPSEIKMYYDMDESEYASKGNAPSSGWGFVSRWFNKNHDQSETEEFGLRRYPVDILYYSHYLPLVGFTGEDDKPDIPPPTQFIFINEAALAKEQTIPFKHMQFPITSFVANPVPGYQDGISDISQLIGTQLAINMLQNATIDSARLMGNPSLFTEEHAEPQDGYNLEPGGVTVFPKGTIGLVKERQTNGNNTAAMNVIQMLKQSIRDTTGDSGGLLSGATPSSVKSGRHANVVLNSVLTRHSLSTTMYDSSWRRWHEQRIHAMQEYADFDTPFWRQQTGISEVRGWSEAMKNLRFDLKLETKADLPFSPSERIQHVIMLWQNGLADLKYVLKILDINLGAELEQVFKDHSLPSEFVPGIPGAQQALMKAQREAQKSQQSGQGQALPQAQGQLQGGQEQPLDEAAVLESVQGGGSADFSSQLG